MFDHFKLIKPDDIVKERYEANWNDVLTGPPSKQQSVVYIV